MLTQRKWAPLILLLSITATGCYSARTADTSNRESNSSGTGIAAVSAPPTTSSAQPTAPLNSKPELDKRSAMEAYQAVLENKLEFYRTENKKKGYLDDFLTHNEVYGTAAAIHHFAVLDMDGDEIPEMVLGLTVDNNSDFAEVLHYRDGEVYGYFFGKDQLVNLKTDGTFRWLSGGLTYNGYGTLSFQDLFAETNNLAYHESKALDESSTTFSITYYIKDKEVTKDSYLSFVKEQEAKKDVAWSSPK